MSTATALAADDADLGSPAAAAVWRPPLALWQLYLLILLTLGIYPWFWTLGVARDMRHHLHDRIRPWLYVVGLTIPLVNLAVIHKQAKQIRLLNASAGRELAVRPWAIVVLAAIAYALSFLLDTASGWWLPIWLGLMLSAFSVPFLILQHQLSGFKAALPGARWTARPFRLRLRQWLAMIPGAAALALVVYGVMLELPRSRGVPVETGAPIRGASGLYTLLAADGDWVRVPVGTIAEDTDLELYGATSDTWVIVFVSCSQGYSLDGVTAFRRTANAADARDYSYSEERQMLPDSLVPVSFAQHSWRLPILPITTVQWVASAVTQHVAIEVIGQSERGSTGETAVEGLVRSLTLTPEAERSCAAS
jgi:hypothetical protein